jgi:phosphoribosyl 1,2-cyclic phosphodiesterase
VSLQLELFSKVRSRGRTSVGLTFASLQSGSEGNATLVAAGKTTLIVDCGISPSRLEKRLAAHGRTIADLSGVLLTHEHSDHAGGAGALARRFGVPLYMNEATARAASGRILRDEDRPFRHILPRDGALAFRDGKVVDASGAHDLRVEWIPVPHDAADPVAFVVERQGIRAAVLTDIGHASPAIKALFETLDLVLLESNHDRERLRDGPYPRSLKQRIASRLGHLSNVEAARLVRDHAAPRLRALLLGHLSGTNNAPALAEEAMRHALAKRRDLDLAVHLTYRDRSAPALEA